MQIPEAEKIYARPVMRKSSYPKLSRKRAVRKPEKEIVYPDSDGKPMSDNTKQFEWIVKIKENLEIMFADNPEVVVAGDLLWYPVKGSNRIKVAPDAMVAFGRPKGHRGSYRMWEEGNIAPQVVFEVLSPGNTPKEMADKLRFYEKYGVSEYYEYDPDHIILRGWTREKNTLCPVENMRGWISPLLKIRFELTGDDLHIFGPDGKKFLSPVESEHLHRAEIRKEQLKAESERRKTLLAEKKAESERRKAESERRKTLLAEKKAESERRKAESERRKTLLAEKKAESEHRRAEQLAAKLRELGIEV